MAAPRRAASSGPETDTDASPEPESSPEKKQPQNASAGVRPETGQIIQIRVHDSYHGWRPAIVLSWLEFRHGEASVD